MASALRNLILNFVLINLNINNHKGLVAALLDSLSLEFRL